MRALKIRAAVLSGGGPMKIKTIELAGPREDEALVRLSASGICHTDIGFIDGGAAEPVVLGHEGAGVVEGAGSRVKGLSPGDHVVLSYMSCGGCAPCRKGHPYDCDRFYEANFGFARLDGTNAYSQGVSGHFFGQSSFATHCLVTERNAVKVSKELPIELLSALGCGLQTGAGTVMNVFRPKKGQSLAVFGTGSVGLAAVMAAKVHGAGIIIGVDIVPKRLRLALELGATHAIDSRAGDAASRIMDITGKGVDFTLETTGSLEMSRVSREILARGGTMADVTGAGGEGALPGGRKAVSIIQGDSVPQEFIPKLIGLYKKGIFPFDRLVSFYRFSEINRAVGASKRGSVIKPVITFGK